PGKKVLIVYAHQEPKSFNGSLLKIAVEELTKQGCRVTVSDLYAMQFEPRATRNDIVGPLHNSEEFNYGVETWEAYKRGGLSKDLVEEQKKVQEADLLIFQVIILNRFQLYWSLEKAYAVSQFLWDYRIFLSSSIQAFCSPWFPDSCRIQGRKGVTRISLFVLFQHGIMHFCGVKVLEPHICYAPEYVSEEKRKEMLTAWTQRLKTLWKEEPINCTPEWYFK
ncbi:NQO2 dehydrogenase, partial [Sakesphorus luctuosus]|nr:NQO2 dehydrogenase [Sakesphorus luctuosus]